MFPLATFTFSFKKRYRDYRSKLTNLDLKCRFEEEILKGEAQNFNK